MVLPGWQEDFTTPPRVDEQAAEVAPLFSDYSRPVVGRGTPVLSKQDQEPARSEPNWPERLSNMRARFTEQASRELQARMREQESMAQAQSPSSRDIPSPAPAVEQTPFAPLAFEPEAREDESFDVDTAIWQAPEQQPGAQDVENTSSQKPPSVRVAEENAMEDQPTLSLNVPSFIQRRPGFLPERSATPQPGGAGAFIEAGHEMEDQPTMPMRLPAKGPLSPPPPVAQTPQPLSNFVDLPPLENRPMSQGSNPPSFPGGYGQTPGPGQFGPGAHPSRPFSQPGIQPSWDEAQATLHSDDFGQRPQQPAFQTPLPNTPLPQPTGASPRAQPRRRRVLVLAILLIVLLLLGGTGAYLVFLHNQSAASNQAVQTTQSYQNSALGFSLSYPQGWTINNDRAHNIVHFADGTATVQVSLARASAGGSTLDQYLNQQATHLGITNQKAAGSASFAGTSWQALQGSVLQGGATYTITLYVAQHNGFFYALTCLTIPNVYAQEEQQTFAPLRQSLQLL